MQKIISEKSAAAKFIMPVFPKFMPSVPDCLT